MITDDPKTRSPEHMVRRTGLSSEVIYRWIALDLIPYTEVPPRSGNFRLSLFVIGDMYGLPTDTETLDKLSALHEPGRIYLSSDELLDQL